MFSGCVRACVRWLGLPVLAQTVDGHDHCGYNDHECGGEHGDPDVAGSDVRTAATWRRERGDVLTSRTCSTLRTSAQPRHTHTRTGRRWMISVTN